MGYTLKSSGLVLGLIVLMSSNPSVAQMPSDFDRKYISAIEQACQSGNVQSCIEGADLWDDDEISNQLYLRFADKACSLGHADSCSNVAYLYDPEEPEEGFKSDTKKYLYYLDRSCGLEDTWSCRALIDIYEDGELIQADYSKSAKYRAKHNQILTSACLGGDASICHKIGERTRAFELATHACESVGNPEASAKNCNLLAEWNDPNSSYEFSTKTAAQIQSASLSAVIYYEKACRINWNDCKITDLTNLSQTLWRASKGNEGRYIMKSLVVLPRDTLEKIADKYCVPMTQLGQMNNLAISKGALELGSVLRVPSNGCDVNKLSSQNVNIKISDRDAQPLVRIPPIMPTRFMQSSEFSGYCNAKFDVSPEGAPFNVRTTYCTSTMLERSTVRSVQKWKYQPKIVNGNPVARSDVESKVNYHLADERGNVLPFPNE